MAKVTELDIRCNNCGALVEQAGPGAVSSCPYCGARYRITEEGLANEGFEGPGKDDAAFAAPPKRARFWIEIEDFRGAMWLAFLLFLGVLTIGWLTSKVPGGGFLLLGLLAAWFTGALVGRLHHKPPSIVARVSAWSLGNLFPMGLVWGLLVSSGLVAIALAHETPAEEKAAPGKINGAPAVAVPSAKSPAKLEIREAAPVIIDGTCATTPKTEGWFGIHRALVVPSTRAEVLAELPDAANRLLVIGDRIVRADLGADDTIRFTSVIGTPWDLPPIGIPPAVVKESKGEIRFVATASESQIAIAFYTGKTRRVVLVDPATGKAGKPVVLPGKIQGEVAPPSAATVGDPFVVAWREGKSVVGFVVSKDGRVSGKWRLAEGVGEVEPRLVWTGEKLGVLFGGAKKGTPSGVGFQELTSTGRKTGKGGMACGLGSTWSKENTFTPSGAVLWRDGAYHIAGGVKGKGTATSEPRNAILHCAPGGEAKIEFCEEQ
jgi:hypothetical protein